MKKRAWTKETPKELGELDAPSKTKKKLEMTQLQQLGDELVSESADFIKRQKLPETLENAILTVQKMTRQDEARRRQMQFIGKLMRDLDEAFLSQLEEAILEIRGQSKAEIARLNRLELLRTRYLEDEQVLSLIIETYKEADAQHFRALRRAALKEREANKPPANFRAIFKELKRLDDAQKLLFSAEENAAV